MLLRASSGAFLEVVMDKLLGLETLVMVTAER